MKTRTPQLLTVLLPTFARELESLTIGLGRADLAAQISGLSVLSRCMCGDPECAHFYTEPRPEGSYGDSHANVVLPAKTGMVVLDLVHGRIVAVEVLDRPDVKGPLDALFPLLGSS